MGINHKEPAYTDKAAPFIEDFGGKIGGIEYLKAQTDLAKFIPPTQIIRHYETYSNKPGVTNVIVRASHPHDFQGLVNIIDSKEVNTQEESVARTIEKIRTAARSPEVISYAQYENSAYDGNITVGVQPLMDSKLFGSDYRRGSIVEHPNQPGTYLIEFIEEWKDITEKKRRDMNTGLYNQAGELLQPFSTFGETPTSAGGLTEMYKEVQRAELVQDDFTFQVEFGLSPSGMIFIYQVRACMKKTLADFSINEKDPDIKQTLVMGITDAKGITVPIVVQSTKNPECPTEPVAILTPRPEDKRNLEFRPENIVVYLAGRGHGRSSQPNLQHGHFWKTQKSDVTIYEPTLYGGFEKLAKHDGQLRNAKEGLQPHKVQIISDGKNVSFKKTKN